MVSLSEQIKNAAVSIGFSKVGFARVENLSGESVHLTEWLNRGYHASMDWMARNAGKRMDPRAILPDARSIISVALNYYSGEAHTKNSDSGKISRYAWGDDYHEILEAKLDALTAVLQTLSPGTQAKAYVDTGPVMEKAWAARAGLGWQGKHTNLITKEFGSWVFLGEIITDLNLDPDEPIADFCGSCTACIEACPTDAIVEPYVVDSNKCLSYLTIEHKGEIPAEFHSKMEQWIYGCDICQDVCPWNTFQQQTEEEGFRPREGNVEPVLNDILAMSQEAFTKRFRKSPIKRTKHVGLVRNARAVRSGRGER